ncbi:hypothetical protein K1T71_008832 [Dendrolimus kikuchii]|uniref:Uncharacterized protein n=1 Tax=Dendrolimus kikuchii TaxID=765133 RepID=A0ACC1CVI9_9NEOP|nr:hypothetical protein K1T71_008832 [Dendrolimus kikuchii]
MAPGTEEQSVVAESDCSNNPGRRLFVADCKANVRYLIDTGSDMCCYPRQLLKGCHN